MRNDDKAEQLKEQAAQYDRLSEDCYEEAPSFAAYLARKAEHCRRLARDCAQEDER